MSWTCRKQANGVKCLHVNPNRKRKCEICGKTRPPRKRPAHMAALDLPYEVYVGLNGGDHCGVCGRRPAPGKKLHRDHDHRTGKPRGLACFRCNSALRPYMTVEWMRAALTYLERTR